MRDLRGIASVLKKPENLKGLNNQFLSLLQILRKGEAGAKSELVSINDGLTRRAIKGIIEATPAASSIATKTNKIMSEIALFSSLEESSLRNVLRFFFKVSYPFLRI